MIRCAYIYICVIVCFWYHICIVTKAIYHFLCNSRLMLGYIYHTYGCTQIHQWYLEICLLICTRNDVEYSRSFSDTCKLSCMYISIICIYVSSVYLVIYKIRVFLIVTVRYHFLFSHHKWLSTYTYIVI